MSAPEAAAMLGVKLPTLYAYVSRGLVRSTSSERGRARRYVRADLEQLCARRGARAGVAAGAAGALHWGEPVLESSISRLTQAGPVYREHSALALAAGDVPFESVAELLWTGQLPPKRPRWVCNEMGVAAARAASLLPSASSPLAALSLLLPVLAARDPARFDVRPEAVFSRARVLMRRLAAGLALGIDPQRAVRALEAGSVAASVLRALGGRGGAAAARALDRALVISADHELNASTFAARVTASTRADVFACVSAALAALSGPWHGAVADRVEALVAEVERPERARRVVHERFRRGEFVPGFGHPYYRGSDPRATALLETARALAPNSRTVRTLLAVVDAMEEAERPGPNVDLGLVAVAAALRLPPGSAIGIFAVGRCAGWIAHVVEQYEDALPLRPRARYLQAT